MRAIPGLVEIHAHLRDPWIGEPAPETFASGTEAALFGGYVAVGDMPNNLGRPTLTVDTYKEKAQKVSDKSFTHVAVHAGYDPEKSDPDEFARLMIRAMNAKFYLGDTTNNRGVRAPADFKTAFEIMSRVNPRATAMLHAHPETLDETLYMTIQQFGLNTHVCHVAADNLPVIANWQKKNGNVRLTSGVTPHHMLMSEHDSLRMGWKARMKPPLESDIDADRLIAALASGEIDCAETDHAPHLNGNKIEAELKNPTGEDEPDCTTCYGVPGLEFAFPIMRNLVRKGLISEERLVEAFTTVPASIMGVRHHSDTKTIFSEDLWEITEEDIRSQCGQSPYIGSIAVGRVVDVQIGGVSRFDASGVPIPLFEEAVLTRGNII